MVNLLDATREKLPGTAISGIEWRVGDAPVGYAEALGRMEERVAAIAAGSAPELVWLLEHPPLYTAGTSAVDSELTDPTRFPTYRAGRGGRWTYHGPGQRIAYVMLDLNRRGRDVRRFVADLEDWVIRTLSDFNVAGEIREGRVGVWVRRPDKGADIEEKIAAIGIRVRRWVSFHGIAVNVEPDLSHFSGIVPCGIAEHGVTSLADLGRIVSMPEVDMALKARFEEVFGRKVTPSGG